MAAPFRRMPSGGVWFAAVSEHGELQADVLGLQITVTHNPEHLSIKGLCFYNIGLRS
jgi:hypothetical protein